ncbi:MAG: tetratricopeptide repeat protein [Bacteroidota bacterium]
MKKSISNTVLTLISLIFSGCFVYNPTAEFFSQRYTNAISYFNTFYNAQRLFSEAEDAVLAAEKEYREIPNQTRPFVIPAAARTKFTASIEKNSKILSFYPDSKWVDDALLMIGKAYYYIDDDVRAQRKFFELSAKYPGSDQAVEGQLWLGRSLVRQKQFDQAVSFLESLIEKTAADFPSIAGAAANELGRYYFSQKDYERSLKYYRLAMQSVRDGSLLALIQFQIAQCYEYLGKLESAEQAYGSVNEYDPGYTLLFNATLYRVKAIAAQRRFDEALESLNDMLDDTKNSDYYGAVHFEIANTLMAKGDTQDAIQKYIFVDTAYARTDVAARSYFALGKYFETVVPQYDSARGYYNKARSEFPASAITAEAIAKSDIFNKYDLLRKDLIRFDSLLTYTIQKKSSDDSVAAATADSLKRIDTVAVPLQTGKATSPGKKSAAVRDSVPPIDSSKVKEQLLREQAYRQLTDSLHRSIVRTKFEFGGLFFVELQKADSALYWFHEVVEKHPKSEYAPRSLYTIAEIYRSLDPKPQPIRDSLYGRIIAEFPASPYAQESRKILGLPLIESEKDPAAELFEQGERLSDENKVEQAIAAFRNVYAGYPASPLAAKALYAIGWHYENSIHNTDSALAVYKRIIVQFPATQFAVKVRPKVSEYESEMKRLETEKQQQIEEQKKKELLEKEQREKPQPQQSAPSDSLSTPQR